jgi:hypothetical protein
MQLRHLQPSPFPRITQGSRPALHGKSIVVHETGGCVLFSAIQCRRLRQIFRALASFLKGAKLPLLYPQGLRAPTLYLSFYRDLDLFPALKYDDPPVNH